MSENAKEIRKTIIEMANRSKSPHVGSALSCADILSALYFRVMRQESERHDYFLLSKAHAAMALYATLFRKGLMSAEVIEGYYQNNGTLPAHTDRFSNEHVEISAGSLGHALPMGIGIAHSLKLENRDERVFILIGDGETQEGSVWESAMLAPRLSLESLIVLIDRNNLQGYGRASELVSFEPLKEKWASFGWEVLEIDGHDEEAIVCACKANSTKPKAIICKTTKGKGVSFMEDELKWHYFIVQNSHKEQALEEISHA